MATFLQPISPVMGSNETPSSVTATNTVIPGTLWGDSAGNQYVYVYNAGNSQISQGMGAVLSGVSGYSVTVSSITGSDMMIGIAKNATLTTGTYGWLMYQGFSGFVAGANDSFSTGNIIAGGVDGTFSNKSSATGFTGPVYGKAIFSVSSGAVTATNAAFFKF